MAGEDELTEHLVIGSGGEGERDLEEIKTLGQFTKHAAVENKKLWYLAGPAIFTSLAQYSLGAVTQVFAGHLTTLELDAVSTENSVIAGLAFGIMEYVQLEKNMVKGDLVHRGRMQALVRAVLTLGTKELGPAGGFVMSAFI